MPEGDTIFQMAAALRPMLVGQRVLNAQARRPGPQIERVVDATVTAVEAIGKHLLIQFDNGFSLHTHMRMAGTWHRYAPGERWRIAAWKARVVLEVPGHVVVCFNAPVCELVQDRALEVHPALAALGPDLLAGDFSADEALARLRARPEMEIAEAITDQRAMAGVGNVYKSEILFIESLNPWTHVGDVEDARLMSVICTAQRLLQQNVTPHVERSRSRRVTTRDDPATRSTQDLFVYGRANKPCPHCATPIRTSRQGQLNRPTYWCPTCQPQPRHLSPSISESKSRWRSRQPPAFQRRPSPVHPSDVSRCAGRRSGGISKGGSPLTLAEYP